MIRTIPDLLRSFPNLLFLVIGDDSERRPLKELVDELGLHASVQSRGEVSDEEMLHCYQQCDLFALPNREVEGDFEGFGMVLLEAQACKKPVIAGASGGTREAISDGNTGYLIDCNRVSEISDTVRELLLDHELARSFGHRGCQRVRTRFSWDALVAESIDIFSLVSDREPIWNGNAIEKRTHSSA